VPLVAVSPLVSRVEEMPWNSSVCQARSGLPLWPLHERELNTSTHQDCYHPSSTASAPAGHNVAPCASCTLPSERPSPRKNRPTERHVHPTIQSTPMIRPWPDLRHTRLSGRCALLASHTSAGQAANRSRLTLPKSAHAATPCHASPSSPFPVGWPAHLVNRALAWGLPLAMVRS
jgi:hypothetical protein